MSHDVGTKMFGALSRSRGEREKWEEGMSGTERVRNGDRSG